jgi:hypothetical protein
MSEPVCADVFVDDDGILENDENFLVILSTNDRAVTITTSISNVDILNDDRKYLLSAIMVSRFKN